MSWSAAEAALDGVLARRWYTNHGPAARALERAVADTLRVPHAVAVTNPAIALVMLLEALAIEDTVQLPALAPLRCLQAVRRAGLRPLFRDDGAAPNPAGALLIASTAEAASWADAAWDRSLPVLSDGILLSGVPAVLRLPAVGDDAGAACVLTADDTLAARLRNIRSSYGAGPPVPVRRTANGRLSEVQAAMALLAWPPAPPDKALWSHLPPGRRIGFADSTGFVAGTEPDHARLLAEPGARPAAVIAPPGTCPAAEALAARTVLLPHHPEN